MIYRIFSKLKVVPCPQCQGLRKTCSKCHGSGVVTVKDPRK